MSIPNRFIVTIDPAVLQDMLDIDDVNESNEQLCSLVQQAFIAGIEDIMGDQIEGITVKVAP